MLSRFGWHDKGMIRPNTESPIQSRSALGDIADYMCLAVYMFRHAAYVFGKVQGEVIHMVEIWL